MTTCFSYMVLYLRVIPLKDTSAAPCVEQTGHHILGKGYMNVLSTGMYRMLISK